MTFPPTATGFDHPDSELIDFLAESGRPKAVEALAQNLIKRNVDQRYQVVWVFLDEDLPPESAWSSIPRVVLSPAVQKQYELAVEKLLGGLLEDKAHASAGGIHGDLEFYNPRVCDLAAAALTRLYPKKYTFKYTDSPVEREANRKKALNVWLASSRKRA